MPAKHRHYQLLGLLLFSNSLFFDQLPAVSAEELVDQPQHTSFPALPSTGHAGLDQTIQQALDDGVLVVEQDPAYAASNQETNAIYRDQQAVIASVHHDYQLQQEHYKQEQIAYDRYQSDLKTYQNQLANYQNYLSAEADYQKQLSQYHQDLDTYQNIVTDHQEKERAHQVALDTYKQQEKDYQTALSNYQQHLADNQQKLADYNQARADYEQQLTDYQFAQSAYDQAKAEEDKHLADYQEQLKAYQQDHREWELEKALYDETVKAAEERTQKDGYLSQVHAQYFIFKNEPNARVTFEGVDHFFDASHDFGNALKGIGGNPKDIQTASLPSLAKNVGGLTAAGAGDGYGLFLKKNHPISVTYTGLEKSSYKGRPITKVVYTFELLSTFSDDNLATAFIYTDPTKTIYTGNHGNNSGQTDFTIRQTISYYYTDEEIVTLDADATALMSLASLNNTFEFGEQEFVRLGDQMTFVPITGSSVSADGSLVAAKGSNNSRADGSKFDRSDWDKDGNDKEYFGAGVAKIVGSTIAFDFGIRYHQDNISQSAKPSQLRNASRLWFAVNTDLKASGILDSTLREEPKEPEKPQINQQLKKPQEPIQPTTPNITEPVKPIPPTEPQKPKLADLPNKPIAPQRPPFVPIPQAPKPAQEPTPPPIPVVFYQRVIVLAPAKPQTITTAKQTTSPKKAGTSQPTAVVRQPRPNQQEVRPSLNQTTHQVRVTYLPQEASRFVHYGNSQPLYPANSYVATPVTAPKQPYKKQVLPKLPESKPLTMKKTPSLMEKEIRDRQVAKFEENTNMNKEEQDIFFGYLDEVKKLAIKKYGYNNKDKINHAIANAIAGIIYQDDFKQEAVNDFNSDDFKQLPGYQDFKKLITNTAIEGRKFYFIDLAHMAMPIATSYPSSWYKEAVKISMTIGNSNKQRGLNWKDIFFWLNAYTGDNLTSFGHRDKDLPTDIDAWNIYKLYPSNTFLDDNIRDYYGKDLNRDKLLNKAGVTEPNAITKSQFHIAARYTLGALAILALVVLKPKMESKVKNAINQTTSFFTNLIKKIKESTKTKNNNGKAKSRNNKTKSNNSKTKSSNNKAKNNNSKTKSSNNKAKNNNSKTKSSNDKTKNNNSKTKSSNNKAKNNNSKTKSSNDKTKNNNSKTKSSNNKAKNNNNKTKSSNNKAKNNNNKTKSSNNKAKNNNSKTKSSNNKAKNNNSKTKSSNNKAKNNNSKTKSSNNKTKNNSSKTKSTKKRR